MQKASIRLGCKMSFFDNYKALAITAAILFISIFAQAQYDSTRPLQPVNSYGNDVNAQRVRTMFQVPTVMPTLAIKDSGAIAYRANELYMWNGTQWNKIVGSGSTSGMDSFAVSGNNFCLFSGGVVKQCGTLPQSATELANSPDGKYIYTYQNGVLSDSILRGVAIIVPDLTMRVSQSNDSIYMGAKSPDSLRGLYVDTTLNNNGNILSFDLTNHKIKLVPPPSITEVDAVVKSITGVVKSNGTVISAASPGSDYSVPSGIENFSGLKSFSVAPKFTTLGASYLPFIGFGGEIKTSGVTATAIVRDSASGNIGIGTLSTTARLELASTASDVIGLTTSAGRYRLNGNTWTAPSSYLIKSLAGYINIQNPTTVIRFSSSTIGVNIANVGSERDALSMLDVIGSGLISNKLSIGGSTTTFDSTLKVVGGVNLQSVYRSYTPTDSMLIKKPGGGVAYREIRGTNYINAQGYGVLPSNTAAQNTTAITAMIAAVSNYSVIYFPNGVYQHNGILINKPVSLMGESKLGTILKNVAVGGTAIIIQGAGQGVERCFIRDIGIWGNGTAQFGVGATTGDGMSFAFQAVHWDIHNVMMRGHGGYTLIADSTGSVNNINISNCEFEWGGKSGIRLVQTNTSAQVNAIFIRNCNISGMAYNGIELWGNNLVVSESTIQNCLLKGITVDGSMGYASCYARGITISNNYFEGCPRGCIYMQSTAHSDGGSAARYIYGITITGNFGAFNKISGQPDFDARPFAMVECAAPGFYSFDNIQFSNLYFAGNLFLQGNPGIDPLASAALFNGNNILSSSNVVHKTYASPVDNDTLYINMGRAKIINEGSFSGTTHPNGTIRGRNGDMYRKIGGTDNVLYIKKTTSSAYGLTTDSTGWVPLLDSSQQLFFSKNVAGDSFIIIKNGIRTGYLDRVSSGGIGTVTSVALTMPGVLFNSSVSGSPITGAGTFSPTLLSQSGYSIFSRGSGTGTPSFQTIDSNWLPGMHTQDHYDSRYMRAAGALTPGSVPFVNSSGILTEDAGGLFYDGTNMTVGHNVSGTLSGIVLNGGRSGIYSYLGGTVFNTGSGFVSGAYDASKHYSFQNRGNVYLDMYSVGTGPWTHYADFYTKVKGISFDVSGTSGEGYLGLIAQSSNPATPSSGVNLFARSTGAFSWVGTNGWSTALTRIGYTGNHVHNLMNRDYTFADSADVAANTVKLVTDSTVFRQALTDSMVATGTYRQVYASNVQTLNTAATTTENTLLTYVIPANSVGVNGGFIFNVLFSATNNANTKTVRIKVNGTTVFSNSSSSFASNRIIWHLDNRNSLSSQISGPATAGTSIQNTAGSSASGVQTTSINTASAMTVTVTLQNATSTDASAIEQFSITTIR